MTMHFDCAPMVHQQTMAAIVQTESSGNPFAIAVVKGPHLKRQPKNRTEAIKLIRYLESIGANYSVGIAQINSSNFLKYGVDGVSLLNTCSNLKVAQKVLQECYAKSGHIQKTLSCYYSGNFKRGFKKDYGGTSYVQRVYKNAKVRIPALISTVSSKLSQKALLVSDVKSKKKKETPETASNSGTSTPSILAVNTTKPEEKACNFLEEFCDVKF